MTKCDNTFSEYEYNKAPLKDNLSEKQDVTKYGWGIRHVQLMIFTLCLIVNFIARGHMGVTIVAMTNNHKENIESINITVNLRRVNETNNILDTNNSIENNLSTNNSYESFYFVDTIRKGPKTYNWPKSTQELVLNSFFGGYTIMMFPIGLVCQRWGGKLPLQIALVVNGIVSLITPWLTIWGGWKAVSFCRFLQGLSQAGTYPSIQALLAKWVPASERGTLVSYVYTGSSLGTIVAFQMGGILADSYGWPSTFWVSGVICLIMFVMVTIFGAATPLEHKTISQAEKNYILGRIDDGSIRRPKMPWKAIVKCTPVWGTMATHIGSNVTYVFIFIQVPSYIHNILGISVKSSGLLTSLPYLASFFASLTFGNISDYCTNNKIISVKTSRTMFNCFSQCGIAIALICVSYTRNITVAVICLVMVMVCQSAVHTGWMINHMDLAPNFAGMLMATGNTLANIANIFLTIFVAFIITDMTNVIQWRIMFFIVAGLCFVTNAIFVLLMSSEVQPWNYAEHNESCIEDPEHEKNPKMDKETQ